MKGINAHDAGIYISKLSNMHSLGLNTNFFTNASLQQRLPPSKYPLLYGHFFFLLLQIVFGLYGRVQDSSADKQTFRQ